MATKENSALLHPLNIEELDSQLNQLTSAYRDTLRFVGKQSARVRLLTVERTNKTPPMPFSAKLNWLLDRKLVIFPFVRLFIEGHIRSKLESVSGLLNVELLALADKNDIRYQKLSHLLKHLEKSLQTVSGWKKLTYRIMESKLLSWVLSFLGPIFAVYIGENMFSASEFGEGISNLIVTNNMQSLMILLQNIIGFCLLLYLLVPFIIITGFNVKRAIFAGGITVADLARKRQSELDNVYFRWPDFADTNIYQLENQIYETLGAKKPVEFPLDLTLSYDIYFLLFWTVTVAFALITIAKDNSSYTLQLSDALSIFLVLGVYGQRIWSAYKHYRYRKQIKNL